PLPMDAIFQRVNNWLPYKYFIVESQIPTESLTTYFEARIEGCIDAEDSLSKAVQLTEVPEEDIPFTLPVALPLRYEL
ncbi:hypothetical protein OAT93_01050, partial [bacterium]|nr:hypothetical protein [bacterium]